MSERERAGDPRGTPAARDLLVVLPCYNELGSLGDVVRRILAAEPDAEILVIDDASPDGTGALADRLAAADRRVRVIHRSGKLGLGSALVLGLDRATAGGFRYAVQMDADGSHLPEQLPGLLAAARGGAGAVIGARWVTGGRIVGWARHRRWISRAGTGVARLCLRSRLHDITSGFRVIDTRWLRRLPLDAVASSGYGFQVEIAWALERAGCPIAEVPITFVERRFGRSKMSLAIVCEALARVITWGVLLRVAPARLGRHAAELSPR